MTNNNLPLPVVLECLERSGYLLESKLVRELTENGFFVEPNQVFRDPRTGKSREIDLIAEHFEYKPEHRNVCVKTNFVVEIVNNKFPIVLLTPRPSSPNENFESRIKFICTPEQNTFYEHFDFYGLREPKREDLFAQYCALTPKRGDNQKEFMASHPDDLYSSFQKLVEYTEDELTLWRSRTDLDEKYWRIFFFHPMLVVGGQLIAATTLDDGTVELNEATSGFLEFNWHAGDEPCTTLIEIIRHDALLKRLFEVVESDAKMESELNSLKMKGREDSK